MADEFLLIKSTFGIEKESWELPGKKSAFAHSKNVAGLESKKEEENGQKWVSKRQNV